MTDETPERRQTITEVFRDRSRERRREYEEAREALLRLLKETEAAAETVDVIAEVAQETGVGEPDVQNALFAMEAAQEVRYQDDRYLVNRNL
jgi:Spy/CpxP family protein refolding chaperone